MDISQLETFLTVVEERSFSRAAARLRRTQPAVSQAVRKLEEELGEQLLERASRDGTPTPAGDILQGYAARLLALRDEAQRAVEQLRSLERGHLTLAANEYTCLYLLPVLDRFRREHPKVEIVVQRMLASRIQDELLRRAVEVGVISFRPESEDLRSLIVYTDDIAFIVDPRHTLARQRRVSLRDLGKQTFIAHNVASPLRRRVEETFLRHRTPLNIGVELPSLEAIKRFVALGNGVALVPALTVQQELDRGELVRIAVPDLTGERHLRLLHRRQGALSHAARAFLRTARDLARERRAPFHYRSEV